MTGQELHEAMQQGCIDDCSKCKLNMKNDKRNCLLGWKKAWEQWTKEESKKFEGRHNVR